MKTWLKSGLVIGLIGGILGIIRLFFMFRTMRRSLGMFGKVGGMALGGDAVGMTVTAYMYFISFIEWFVISFIIGAIIGLIIQKVRKK